MPLKNSGFGVTFQIMLTSYFKEADTKCHGRQFGPLIG